MAKSFVSQILGLFPNAKETCKLDDLNDGEILLNAEGMFQNHHIQVGKNYACLLTEKDNMLEYVHESSKKDMVKYIQEKLSEASKS